MTIIDELRTLNGSGRIKQKQETKHADMEKESPRRKNWKIRVGVMCNEGIKDHGFGLERSEMVGNSCLEDLEGRMRARRMLKLVP